MNHRRSHRDALLFCCPFSHSSAGSTIRAATEPLPMVSQEQPISVSRSTTLTIPELEHPKTAILIRSLLYTLGGAMHALSRALSPGAAANLD